MGLSVVVEGIRRVSRQLGSKVGCEPAEQGGELAPGDRSRRTVGAVAPPVDDAQRGKAVDGAGVSAPTGADRSEERRVGNAGDSRCRSRWSTSHYKKNTQRKKLRVISNDQC